MYSTLITESNRNGGLKLSEEKSKQSETQDGVAIDRGGVGESDSRLTDNTSWACYDA
jgi:hypothetical protein